MVWTKEQKAAYGKKWRDNNKEYQKEYQEENKEHIKEHKKEYRQTPAGIKTRIITDWKRNGLIYDDYNALYELYLNAKHCDVCKIEFKNSYYRCMDHCHTTGLFRQFLCRGCNNGDGWQNKIN